MAEKTKTTGMPLAAGILGGLALGTAATYLFADPKRRKIVKKTFTDVKTSFTDNVQQLKAKAPVLEAETKKTTKLVEKKAAALAADVSKKEAFTNGRIVH